MSPEIAQLMPLVLIGVVFYFLLIRPQQKRVKDHRAMIEAVRRGDNVVTAGGVMGKVTKVRDDNVVQVEIAPEIKIDVVKSTLSEVRGKAEPANGNTPAPGADGSSGGLFGMFKKK